MQVKNSIKVMVGILALILPASFLIAPPVHATDYCGLMTAVYGPGYSGKPNSVGIKYISGDGDHITLKATDGSTSIINFAGVLASGSWGDENATSAFISRVRFPDTHTLEIKGVTTRDGIASLTTKNIAFAFITGGGFRVDAGLFADNINKIAPVTSPSAGTGLMIGGYSVNGTAFTEGANFITCPAPSGVVFTAATASVPANSAAITTTAGTPITFSWNGTSTGATGCWGFESGPYDNWYGSRGATGSLVVTASVSGTYTLNCWGGPSGSTNTSIVVTVNPNPTPPPTPTTTFTAQTATMAATSSSFTTTPGTPITFNWSAAAIGATGCFGFESGADNWYGAKATSGSLVVNAPTSTRTYTLDCWDSATSHVTKSITVSI